MAKKVLQIPLDQIDWEWIEKGKKELKTKKTPEFVRAVFAYLRENAPEDLKNRMEKARLSSMLEEAERTEADARKAKESLAKQLEKIGVNE